MTETLPPLSAADLQRARSVVSRLVPRTPARRWPMIEAAVGTEAWIKHENHNPTGSFKVRGGVNFMARALEAGGISGVVSASRGNHSQSLAFSGAQAGIPVTVVVPEGNSPDKNAATEAFGAELIIHGKDFQESMDLADQIARDRDWTRLSPIHEWLVEGVATYAAELFEDVPDLDVMYVPVGIGSGICAAIAVRDLIGAKTEIVGVVAENAPAYALSFEAGEVVSTESSDTFVDGIALRAPDPRAVGTILAGASRMVRISESDAAAAMALMYRSTHNLAEPAGAIALAAAIKERDLIAGRRVAIIQTGGNADFTTLQRVMNNQG